MQDLVRIGIVGCGAVMEHYLAAHEGLLRSGAARVTAACDRAEGKRALMEERYGVGDFFTDPEQVVTHPNVDLLLVFTPVVDHAALTCAALDAGKHVLVEKTIGTRIDEAAAVLAAAHRHPDRLLLCAPHVLLSPTYQAIWGRVKRGEIGPVFSARARYGWAAPFWQGDWVYQRGGGALFEFAVYNVTSLTGLLGPVRRVMATSQIAIPEREVGGRRVKVEEEDNAHLLLDFGSGVIAAVTTSFTFQRYRSPALELYGRDGTLQMLGDDWAPAGHELWRNEAGCWQLHEETAPQWSWTDGLRHIVACLRERRPLVVGPDHAYHVLDVLLAARRAARDGVAQTIGSRFEPPRLSQGGVSS